jgi:hypothetical protein
VLDGEWSVCVPCINDGLWGNGMSVACPVRHDDDAVAGVSNDALARWGRKVAFTRSSH